VELLYNKDVHALYHTDINHPNYDRSWVTNLGGADNRPYLIKNKLNSEAYDVIMLTNTNKGYSFYTTLQLQKDFLTGPLKGLYLNGSYTFGVSKSVTDGSSSVASSAYKYRPAVNPDADELGYSAGSFPDRILLQASYRIEYAKSMATSIGVIYQRYMPFRYSYTYNGDVNNDSYSYNDLIFVPEKMSDIRIVPAAGDKRSELARHLFVHQAGSIPALPPRRICRAQRRPCPVCKPGRPELCTGLLPGDGQRSAQHDPRIARYLELPQPAQQELGCPSVHAFGLEPAVPVPADDREAFGRQQLHSGLYHAGEERSRAHQHLRGLHQPLVPLGYADRREVHVQLR